MGGGGGCVHPCILPLYPPLLRYTNESVTIVEAAETVVRTETAADEVQYAQIPTEKKEAVWKLSDNFFMNMKVKQASEYGGEGNSAKLSGIKRTRA